MFILNLVGTYLIFLMHLPFRFGIRQKNEHLRCMSNESSYLTDRGKETTFIRYSTAIDVPRWNLLSFELWFSFSSYINRIVWFKRCSKVFSISWGMSCSSMRFRLWTNPFTYPGSNSTSRKFYTSGILKLSRSITVCSRIRHKHVLDARISSEIGDSAPPTFSDGDDAGSK